MEPTIKEQLSPIRQLFEVDKDIKIQQLEKQIATLKTNHNKYKAKTEKGLKELHVFRSSVTDPNFLKKYASKTQREHYRKGIMNRNKEIAALKAVASAKAVKESFYKFLINRIKKIHGNKLYSDLIMHIDNPDPSTMNHEPK